MAEPLEPLETLIQNLPFPVAFRCRWVMGQTAVRDKVEALLDAYDSVARFLALVAVSDYLRGVRQEAAVDQRLKELFSKKISLGDWVGTLRETLRIYAASPETCFMPELLSFYLRDGRGRLTPEASDFEGWVHRRNEIKHPRRTLTEEEISRRWEVWWADFHRLLASLTFLSSYDLIIPAVIKRDRVRKAWVCRGPFPQFRFEDKLNLALNVKGVEAEESLLLLDRQTPARQLLLYPFMMVRLPAEFYLFDQGERREGNLNRVIFARLDPGQEMVIRRADHQGKVLVDLENRLQRVGEVGVVMDHLPRDRPVACEEEGFREFARLAGRWARAGRPYYMVEEIGPGGQALLRHPPDNFEIQDEDLLSLLMSASLHFGGRWRFWVEKAAPLPPSLQDLVQLLRISYDRPRFRTLYVLQVFFRDRGEEILAHPDLDPDLRRILTQYVLEGKVLDYLVKVRDTVGGEIGRKAARVIQEIEQQFGSGSGGEKRSGLPEV